MILQFQPTVLAVEQHAGVTLVRFPQRNIDGKAIRELYELTAALSDHRNVKLMVDMTDVPMASSGLMGMLVTMKKKCLSFGAQLHIAVPDPQVMQAFQIMNLHLILQLFKDPAEARAKFKA